MTSPSSPKIVVVGARGTLGQKLTFELGCEGVDFRAGHMGEQRALIEEADVVINVGGPRVRPGLREKDYLREHVGVAKDALDAMNANAHFIHISSTAVFGKRDGVLRCSDIEQPEQFPMPGYARAKLAAERYVVAHAKRPISVFRPSMVIGAGVDSVVASLAKLARRKIALRLLPRSLHHHLTQFELLVAALRAAILRPSGPKPLVLADPFLLDSDDLLFPARLTLPIALTPLSLAQAALRTRLRLPILLDTFAVLALDNIFDWEEGFERLGLKHLDFARARTFDRYKSDVSRMLK